MITKRQSLMVLLGIATVAILAMIMSGRGRSGNAQSKDGTQEVFPPPRAEPMVSSEPTTHASDEITELQARLRVQQEDLARKDPLYAKLSGYHKTLCDWIDRNRIGAVEFDYLRVTNKALAKRNGAIRERVTPLLLAMEFVNLSKSPDFAPVMRAGYDVLSRYSLAAGVGAYGSNQLARLGQLTGLTADPANYAIVSATYDGYLEEINRRLPTIRTRLSSIQETDSIPQRVLEDISLKASSHFLDDIADLYVSMNKPEEMRNTERRLKQARSHFGSPH